MFKFVAASSALFAVAHCESANPLRRVISLLQNLQKELETEAVEEQKLYDNFECYCTKNKAAMSKDAEEAAQKIEELKGKLVSEQSEKATLDQELVQHKADREQAKADLAQATALRAKDKEAFEAENKEFNDNIKALNGAVAALEKGAGNSAFLQNHPAAKANLVMVSAILASHDFQDVDSSEKRRLSSFLQNPYGAYSSQTGEITGIIKQLKDEMDRDLGGVVAKEEAAVAAFAELSAAKQREIQAHTDAIEAKSVRSGQLAVDIVTTQNDLKDTIEGLGESQKFLAQLAGSCDDKGADFEARKKTRNDEISAISEAIKVLNDDDALDIFKKTVNTNEKAALIQKSKTNNVAMRARSLLETAAKNKALVGAASTELDLIASVLKSGKAFDLGKVSAMIDEMVEVLKKEQSDDDSHRDWCTAEKTTNEANDKESQRKVDNLAALIAETEEKVATLKSEIAQAQAEIVALDKQVADATDLRKKENAEYTSSQSELNTAVELIEKAKNKLNRVYNPAAFKEDPKPVLTEAERIAQNISGGSLVQIRAHEDKAGEAPAPPPETWGAYQNKGQKVNGVVSLMDMILGDLRADIQEGQHEEKTAQRDYEKLMADSASSREQLSQSITDKAVSVSEGEIKVQDAKTSKATETETLLGLRNYLAQLKASCDFLEANYEIRKESRSKEIEGLVNAKAVLAGANFSF